MADSTTNQRQPNRRVPSAALREVTASPRTPMLGRSISSQFGSPGAFRAEQEDVLVYELGARHFSAGFAGESRPRCILPFTSETGRRAGDYRMYDPSYAKNAREWRLKGGEDWSADHELYRMDVRDIDLGLVEDKLERALRIAMSDYLQLDAKPRKAILVIPSLLPNPLVEVALRVLFAHFTQPPAVAILTIPVMSCVSAGIRTALVVDIGWEETVVTAVGEYKEIAQHRSIRAGKMLTREVVTTLEQHIKSQGGPDGIQFTFDEAEDIAQRMAWCQRRDPEDDSSESVVQLPLPASDPPTTFPIAFNKLAEPAERTFFPLDGPREHDDHDQPLNLLTYRVLMALQPDARAVCVSRVIITGGASNLPGLKKRLLQELSHLVETRGWTTVSNYGSAAARHAEVLKQQSVNMALRNAKIVEEPAYSPAQMPLQEHVPHADRIHDHLKDPLTLKAETEANRGKVETVKGVIRGVETLGPWAGASLMAMLRVKGACEIEREDFIKHGLTREGRGGVV
ncbi:related to actin-related protein RO7 [Ramularia collo-cygni]|uniref:Related to actin-related protein RO7 n=1 Tax=Ramularia collo-cygni TaxID=112498 RepID=A0A2D3US60_9PEZI|nr:related to actin-related protein RO7 [Ramularia collo-cygni]CZT17558.1 related to actin-related protein RO7 [Ramularia collo-cygni]